MSDDARPFEIGQIVRLRSGGPSMTVSGYFLDSLRDELLVEVDWFSGTKAQHRNFRATSLEPVEDDNDAESR